MALDDTYTVKGIFNEYGAFDGALARGRKKFSTIRRGIDLTRINCECSSNKEEMFLEYKQWLKKSKITQFKFLSEKINHYIAKHPRKTVIA